MKKVIIKILFKVYLGLLLVKNLPIAGLEEILLVRFLQLLGLVLFALIVSTRNFRNYIPISVRKNVAILLVFSFLGSLLAGFHQSRPGNVLVIINVLGFIAFGLHFVFFKNTREMKIFFLILMGYTLIQMYFGTHIKQWFRGSYNHVSTIFLFSVVGYYAQCLNRKQTPLNLIPVLFVVYICFVSTGRSAIISSLWLLVIVLFFNLRKGIKGFLISCMFLAMLVINADILIEYSSQYLEKFTVQGFAEAGREMVFQFAKRNLSIQNILMGINYEYLFKRYDLSIHNSFLSIHSRFGIFGFTGFVFLPFLLYLRRRRVAYIWLFLVSVLFLRSFTDSILISDGFLFGPLYFVLLFSAFRSIRGYE